MIFFDGIKKKTKIINNGKESDFIITRYFIQLFNAEISFSFKMYAVFSNLSSSLLLMLSFLNRYISIIVRTNRTNGIADAGNNKRCG